jgi:hypothetical protein
MYQDGKKIKKNTINIQGQYYVYMHNTALVYL